MVRPHIPPASPRNPAAAAPAQPALWTEVAPAACLFCPAESVCIGVHTLWVEEALTKNCAQSKHCGTTCKCNSSYKSLPAGVGSAPNHGTREQRPQGGATVYRDPRRRLQHALLQGRVGSGGLQRAAPTGRRMLPDAGDSPAPVPHSLPLRPQCVLTYGPLDDGGIPEDALKLLRELPEALQCLYVVRVPVFVVWDSVGVCALPCPQQRRSDGNWYQEPVQSCPSRWRRMCGAHNEVGADGPDLCVGGVACIVSAQAYQIPKSVLGGKVFGVLIV